MMEGVLPEAWDLILFKTMVLYIYKTADNIKTGKELSAFMEDLSRCIPSASEAGYPSAFAYSVYNRGLL